MFEQNDSKYFAADSSDKTVSYLQRKASYWYDSLINNNYLDKIKRSWMSYHGSYYENGHQIGYGGEQGELVTIAVNHYNNIGRHIINMVTANRPAFQPRAINTDHTSQVQTTLAHGLLEYYMRERRVERKLLTAVEYAVILGTGYVKMGWNSTSGKIYDYIADDTEEFDDDGNVIDSEGFPVYEGDIEFVNMSPYDVVFDTTKESSQDHDWVLTRTFKNKHDLAAKYPEYEDEIRALQTKSDTTSNRMTLTPMDETLDIPVYEFYHNRTESLPDGRYLLYLSSDIILIDTPMPYRRLPVYRVSPSDILGTPFGYTNMWDLLPIQDAINSLYSTILTNQNAFGVQNVLNPRGNDIKVSSLEGSLNFIEYNAQAGKPEALNLTKTPAEIFNFVQMLVKEMETISGVNSVARGNPEASLRTGTALALVQSQALQFMSGLQRSYVQMIEDVGTGIIELLQDFAAVPRIAEISGIANETKMKYFKGSDLKDINRVIVDSGNALSNTTAGKAEMASNLLQMGLVTSPDQYFSVLNSGKLDTLTQGKTDELLLIKKENERLFDGEVEVVAIDTDNHSLHINEHRGVVADPDIRINSPELVERTLVHIQEHLDALRTVDPDLLDIIQQQAIAPRGGADAAGGLINDAQAQSMEGPDVKLPKPASPATSPDGMPVNPVDIPLA